MDQNSIGDRYDLGGRIGRGGMAQVYLATDRLLGRQVAVKVLDRALADDAAFVERDSTGGPSRGRPQPPQHGSHL
jgi:serine/threonine-protein kinase